jgi:cytosolic carboxypeptidase protein 5
MGILDILLKDGNDVLRQMLLGMFVFKIIPMINPDGVDRGHFRMDCHGNNLNRFYHKPDKIMQPSVYAITQLNY